MSASVPSHKGYTQRITFYCAFCARAGSNLICAAIHRALSRLFETHVADGEKAYIDELFCQVDNCVGENKNHILVGFMGSLVARGVVGRVEINFMLVGHTHIKIDQIFSRQVGRPLVIYRLSVCTIRFIERVRLVKCE